MEVTEGAPLLDSDIVIWILRGDKPTLEFVENLRKRGYSLTISVVTAYEIYAGMREGEEEAIETLLSSLKCLQVTSEIAKKAAEYFRNFRLQGRTLHIPDLLIAATAFCHKLRLVTYNRKDFPMTDIAFWEDLPTPPERKPRQ